MVVKSLVLGDYKSLNVSPLTVTIDQDLVMAHIKQMLHDREMSMGFRQQNPDGFLIVDDEAVKGLEIEGVDSLDQLKAHLGKQLLQDGLINSVMRQVLDNVKITYDEAAVDQELDIMMVEVERQAKNEGFTLDFYCDYNGLDGVEALRTLYRDEIKTSYLEYGTLELIAEKEGIQIRPKDLEHAMARYEQGLGESVVDAVAFKKSLLMQETVNWLVSVNVA